MPAFHFKESPYSDDQLINIGMNDSANGYGFDDSPEDAARWIIEQLDDEAMQLSGDHLHEFDVWLFSHAVFDLPEERRVDGGHAITRGVKLVRSRVERCNRLAWPSGKVSPGLWVPWSIEYRYETIYQAEFPWAISLVMQNAFLGNPVAAERQPWRNARPLNASPAPF